MARLQRAAEQADGEHMVQLTVAAEIPTEDSPMITRVTEAAGRISALLRRGHGQRADHPGRAFRQQLPPHPRQRPRTGDDPVHRADRCRSLPPIQEAMLETDPRIVFCAAVDRNGYLPTHNRKFSQPQGSDPVWNAANCRNRRRIFDDRVGPEIRPIDCAPFLLQVYRRDMGGGNMVMMKDLSAPITRRGAPLGRAAARLQTRLKKPPHSGTGGGGRCVSQSTRARNAGRQGMVSLAVDGDHPVCDPRSRDLPDRTTRHLEKTSDDPGQVQAGQASSRPAPGPRQNQPPACGVTAARFLEVGQSWARPQAVSVWAVLLTFCSHICWRLTRTF